MVWVNDGGSIHVYKVLLFIKHITGYCLTCSLSSETNNILCAFYAMSVTLCVVKWKSLLCIQDRPF